MLIVDIFLIQADQDVSQRTGHDEDVDGVPLDDAEAIDGAPLSDSEDLDGNNRLDPIYNRSLCCYHSLHSLLSSN